MAGWSVESPQEFLHGNDAPHGQHGRNKLSFHVATEKTREKGFFSDEGDTSSNIVETDSLRHLGAREPAAATVSKLASHSDAQSRVLKKPTSMLPCGTTEKDRVRRSQSMKELQCSKVTREGSVLASIVSEAICASILLADGPGNPVDKSTVRTRSNELGHIKADSSSCIVDSPHAVDRQTRGVTSAAWAAGEEGQDAGRLRFEGSSTFPLFRSVPPHGIECEDHAPAAFSDLRRLYGISDHAYVESMRRLHGGAEGDGKSGQLFFVSDDQQFVIKTVTAAELGLLCCMLEDYYHHVLASPDTLICRFFGLHTLRPAGGTGSSMRARRRNSVGSASRSRVDTHGIGPVSSIETSDDNDCLKSGAFVLNSTMHFVVMGNAMAASPAVSIEVKFDLKGSLRNRMVPSEDIEKGRVGVLKDLNLGRYRVRLPRRSLEALMRQARIDVYFLRRHRLMDYSLLLGVSRPVGPPEESITSGVKNSAPGEAKWGEQAAEEARISRWAFPAPTEHCFSPSVELACTDTHKALEHQAGPFRASRWQRCHGGTLSSKGAPGARSASLGEKGSHEVYFLALIDVLQSWNWKKRGEHLVKTTRHGEGAEISCVDPDAYADRLLDFLERGLFVATDDGA